MHVQRGPYKAAAGRWAALGLSAAFDTVDHDILLRRVELSFGITGAALNWIRSFLSERTQAVTFFGERSSTRKLACGVPQGSVLGPLLFILYTADVIRIASSMGVRVHCYADDTQLYISGSERDAASTMSKITDCIDAISLWMSSNRLKLNGDKTQFIWLGSRQRLAKISKDNLVIQGAEISPLDSVRDLGVIIDCKLTMEDHVNSVVKSCFFQLRQLRSIRRSLPTDARKALVHSFVASRIDYCNAILCGVSDRVVRRMQTALNAAARLVVDAGRRQHMTPILQSLHWLPVKQRILYKIGIISFHCVRGDGPAYLTEMFSRVSVTSGRANLRSAARGDFVIPRTNTMTFGPRSFRVSGPTFWNMLPLDMRDMNISPVTFKSKLKTFLFMRAFPGAFET